MGALQFFDGQRYDLVTNVVMPNHVHVVFRQAPGFSLDQILHAWKSYTSHQVGRVLGTSGSIWQDDYWDRLVRNEAHLQAAIAYVLNNPIKAGLKDWPWIYLCDDIEGTLSRRT